MCHVSTQDEAVDGAAVYVACGASAVLNVYILISYSRNTN
jgi:hypothetical protein